MELENQGGGGTSFAHWEQRVLGVNMFTYKLLLNLLQCTQQSLFQNEGMTGVILFNIRFSRITFGLMEDTGLVNKQVIITFFT